MRDGGSSEVPGIGNAVARIFAAFIHPIAWPGWAIEWLVNRWRPGWFFSPYTATPYFLVVAIGSALGVVRGSWPVAIIGLYLLTAMEALALWICLTIAVGRPGAAFSLLRQYGKRQFRNPGTLLSAVSLYMGVVSYGYTIFYFAFANYFLFRMTPAAFKGIEGQSAFARTWEFMYYSTVTIATLGYGDITPERTVSQAMTVVELIIGMFFGLFVFGAFVSFHVTRVGKGAA